MGIILSFVLALPSSKFQGINYPIALLLVIENPPKQRIHTKLIS
jgi:hypothetical protein